MRDHSGLDFSLGEYQRRRDAAVKRIQDSKLDALVINSPDTIFYMTGYQTSGYDSFTLLVIGADGRTFMITRLLEQINVHRRTWLETVYSYQDHEDPIQVVKASFSKELPGVKTIGLEKDSFFLKYSHIRQLQELWSDKTVSDATGLLNPLRVQKSEEEIGMLMKAARSTEAGILAGIEATREGCTENEIAADVHAAMFRAGGEYPSVPPYITSGPRSIISHSTWEGRKINRGDNVFIEVGGCFRRYHTAMMRTVFVGNNPPVEIRESAELIKEELEVLMQNMKPGVTAGEIDRLTRNPERLEAIGATRVSRTGYGLGISFAPAWDEGHIISLVQGDSTPLQNNMVFHLIPWVQLPKLDTVVGISETVRVTDNGAVSFFNLPRELVVKA